MTHRPHSVIPSTSSIRVAIVYKNFAANKGISHIGLGVAALNTMQTLRQQGIWVEVWPTVAPADLEKKLRATQQEAFQNGQVPVSHVIISAPWIPTVSLQAMLMAFPQVHFTVVSHSNVGFLMADPNGIKLLRDGLQLQGGYHNFSLAGNSQKFVDAWRHMYGTTIAFLPNLYNVQGMKAVGERMPWHQGVLRIGIFGATRPLKNMVSASAAAVQISKRLKTDVEIWTSSGREEGGGDTVSRAIGEIVSGLAGVKLVRSGWQSWSGFRQVVSSMHLLLQPSYTESFNMVTADGVHEGVASVVSDAIDWVPESWIAHADKVDDIAQTGVRLLHDSHAVNDGQRSLRHYVTHGISQWENFLLHRHGQ